MKGAQTNWALERSVTYVAIAASCVALGVYSIDVIGGLRARLAWGDLGGAGELAGFLAILYLFFVGGLAYMITRLGHVNRERQREHLDPDEARATLGADAPSLVFLVPSYREETDVIRRTLLSAALQDYPNRRVVLLLDDPPDPTDPDHAAMLERARALPAEIRRLLKPMRDRLSGARNAWRRRRSAFQARAEGVRLAELHRDVADWFLALAADHPGEEGCHVVFREQIVGERAQAAARRAQVLAWASPTESEVDREYERLATLFDVDVTAFERKRYANLSHAANKAMNLNSYLALLGGWFEEVEVDGATHLLARPEARGVHVPDADLVSILDADTVVAGHAAATLVSLLRRPESADVAVIQTPYQAYPRFASVLERAAAANTDVMYVAHTGFTRFGAGFMIGASTIVRMAALREVRRVVLEDGHLVERFVHDRTMIEDAETSVDLIAKGWRVHNHLDRLSWSATPPDFGTLVIQRRRWANGGLILLPKFVGHVLRSARHPLALVGAAVSTQYLAVGAIVNLGMLAMLVYPFEKLPWSPWGPIAAVPYFALYGRDLVRVGYRWSDLARVYALNLLLIPIVLGGSAKSIEQVVTGRRAPFGRTPKVPGRTAAPGLYVAAVFAMLVFLAYVLGVDVARQRWVHAAFTGFNGAMLLYAAVVMVHPGGAIEDLLRSVRRAA